MELLRNCMVIAASGVAMYVGIVGLNTWRRQLKGSAEYELARRLIKQVLQLREAFKVVRNPTMWSSEFGSPPDEERERMTDDQIRAFGRAKAYEARWQPVRDTQAELDITLIEAEVLWDETVNRLFEPIRKLRAQVQQAIWDELTLLNPDTDEGMREAILAAMSNSERMHILYRKPGREEDDFEVRLDGAISALKTELAPHLRQ